MGIQEFIGKIIQKLKVVSNNITGIGMSSTGCQIGTCGYFAYLVIFYSFLVKEIHR